MIYLFDLLHDFSHVSWHFTQIQWEIQRLHLSNAHTDLRFGITWMNT